MMPSTGDSPEPVVLPRRSGELGVKPRSGSGGDQWSPLQSPHISRAQNPLGANSPFASPKSTPNLSPAGEVDVTLNKEGAELGLLSVSPLVNRRGNRVL